MDNDEKLRAEYERLKACTEGTMDMGEDDQDALRAAILDDMDSNAAFSADEFAEILDKELSVFKNG